MNAPDFLIVGAGKSGTSSLHYYLSLHPEICMPQTEKELNFWHTYQHEKERGILNRNPSLPTTYNEYQSYFKLKTNKQISGEACPSYLYYYKDTVNNLKELKDNWQDIKIIIILREPIDKIWSHYKFIRSKNLDPDKLSLSDSLKLENKRLGNNHLLPDLFLVDNTRYYEQVLYYQSNFNNVKVLLYDDLVKNTQKLLNEITEFLGVKRFVPDNLKQIYNASKDVLTTVGFIQKLKGKGIGKLMPERTKRLLINTISTKEKMSPKTRLYLQSIFKPEVEKLNTVIDKDLSSWLEQYG
jgi:sulfotransferase family protein